jgi:hypothetical protein
MYRGLRDRARWPDRSTANIPLQYYVMAALLADAAEEAGIGAGIIASMRADAAEFRRVAEGEAAAVAGL